MNEKVLIKDLKHNNVFYYDGKVYALGQCVRKDGSVSAMECHDKGKHKDFKPDTEVLSITPEFMKDINKDIGPKNVEYKHFNQKQILESFTTSNGDLLKWLNILGKDGWINANQISWDQNIGFYSIFHRVRVVKEIKPKMLSKDEFVNLAMENGIGGEIVGTCYDLFFGYETRRLIITSCADCYEHCPVDSYGVGTLCGENSKVVSELDNEPEIPEWCPKLNKE